jgi:hypothetical protein
MTAKYKRRRLLTENSIDWRPYNFKFEGAERQEAKREIAEEVNAHIHDQSITEEMIYEREMRLATECYEKQKADPNYRCTCFLMDEE